MSEDEKILRELLWLRHGCPTAALYGDDGKMHCNACLIDFKNAPAHEIRRRFWAINARRIADAKYPSDRPEQSEGGLK